MVDKKKKLIIRLIIFIIIIILVYIVIRIINPVMKVVVVKYNEEYSNLIVIDKKNKEPYYISLPQSINLQFKQGQEVKVYFKLTGAIIDQTYPISIKSENVQKVKILKEESDIRYSK